MSTEKLMIELDAKTGKLDAGLDSASSKLDKLDGKTQKADKSLFNMSKVADGTGKGLSKMGSMVKAAGISVTALAAAATATAVKMAEMGKEIKNNATIMNTSVEQVQAYSHAFQTVGVDMDQLADISKDSLERIGDYLNTGGGPLQDYADAMGMTAEETREFAKEMQGLDGVQVLQTMTTNMQEAGVGAEQMSHALEGMASDATKAIPLLSNQGEELARLTEEYHKFNTALSDEDIKELSALSSRFSSMGESFTNMMGQVVLNYSDSFDGIIATTQEGMKLVGDEFASGSFNDRMNSFYNALVNSWGVAFDDMTGISDETFGDIEKYITDFAAEFFGIVLTIPIHWRKMANTISEIWFDIVDEIQIKMAELNVTIQKGLDLVGQGDVAGAQAQLDAITAQTDARDQEHEKEMERLEQEKQKILEKFYAEQEAATTKRETYAADHKTRMEQIETENDAVVTGSVKTTKQVQSGISATTKTAVKGSEDKAAAENDWFAAASAATEAVLQDSKAAQYANTVINTSVAIMRALADLGPIAGPIAAASMAATGAMQLAAISDTNKGTSGSVSAGAMPTAPSEPEQSSVNVDAQDSSNQSNAIVIKFEGNGDDVTEAIAKNMKVMEVNGQL